MKTAPIQILEYLQHHDYIAPSQSVVLDVRGDASYAFNKDTIYMACLKLKREGKLKVVKIEKIGFRLAYVRRYTLLERFLRLIK